MAQITFVAAVCVLVLSHSFLPGVKGTTFTMVNKCDYVVWPGILSNAGVPTLPTTGFTLQRGETKTINAPTSWGGRFWGRTHCSQDSSGKFSCLTGDCGSGKLECSGNGAAPPATLVEFTLDGADGLDFFDISLVDGYNIPMMVVPHGGTGQNCTYTGCVGDLNDSCPSELKVVNTENGAGSIACKSACEAFRQPQYCCSGAYGTPDTCKPSSYSEVFKRACPRAYSYAYDDKTSTFTCAKADYTITFCPSPNTSQKSSQGQNTETRAATTSPLIFNSTMVYEGAFEGSAASPRIFAHAIVGIIGITIAMRWLF
ncbi:Thaumatin-like protein 1 [Hibiscus syriacus]|uniref:Thaumatin-like protein 1 n=1 Tax=Hibiscus syriacus TaxID=106335 RepID=A0A6A3CR05_HIBSY|nr:pathogenesis-related thaumatin-like protein 3.5 [Hibiscus syriacus]KAE8731396.1 Thaumatin-like protein 1 [Hibiscus syriacus]